MLSPKHLDTVVLILELYAGVFLTTIITIQKMSELRAVNYQGQSIYTGIIKIVYVMKSLEY